MIIYPRKKNSYSSKDIKRRFTDKELDAILFTILCPQQAKEIAKKYEEEKALEQSREQ